MTTWKPPHKTARQRKRDPLDKAQLAPAPAVVRNVCPRCGCPMLIHRDGVCLRVGCDCCKEDTDG